MPLCVDAAVEIGRGPSRFKMEPSRRRGGCEQRRRRRSRGPGVRWRRWQRRFWRSGLRTGSPPPHRM
ncbi:hypothetical protein RchiOBHm_Chr6g0262051 [Rosa chinensis]|uniref:Uncharacterized protein n=1 Tax=Rosa chinensis TaxID=74649 RepID=A0A2P6PNI9_ROSCH|nr:hypothetical protein RchiOBHm_Chr6g0262051 [Rosa chinensis]